MAYYRCNGAGSSGVNVQKMVELTESEFNALVSKSDDAIYIVTNANRNLHIYTYQGDRRILNYIDESELSEYEFWYEDVYYINNIISTGNAAIEIPLAIFAAENAGRDFELRFSCNPASGQQYNYIISDVNEDFALRIDTRYYPDQVILHGAFNETDTNNKWLNYTYGTEFIYKRVNNNIQIWSGGSMIDQWPARSYTSNLTCVIGNYSNYYFNGNLKYIGFKWLS